LDLTLKAASIYDHVARCMAIGQGAQRFRAYIV